jgi:hypothetical protein
VSKTIFGRAEYDPISMLTQGKNSRTNDSRAGTIWRVNDPSAGSPTETLLRLLLPLSLPIHRISHCNIQNLIVVMIQAIHRNTQSVGATGGVYKGQGRNQRELMTHAY